MTLLRMDDPRRVRITDPVPVGISNPNPGLLGPPVQNIPPGKSPGLLGAPQGAYGGQAYRMANPVYTQMQPFAPLGTLPNAPQSGGGGSGGSSGGSDWLSALMLGARASDLTGIGLDDIINRFRGGSNPAEDLSRQGAQDTSATNAWAGSELAGLAAPTLAESAVPAGTVTITEGGGLLGGAGGAAAGGGLAGLAAGAEAGALGGLGATAAAGEAALLGGAAPTLAPIATGAGGAAGAGAALGGGASADAAAGLGAAGGASAGLLASLGIAAIPAILAATTPFGKEIHDESSQAARALQGLGMTSIRTAPSDPHNAQNLFQLPNGEFIASSDGLRKELGNRWGKEPAEATLAWLMSFPRVQYSIPHFAQQSGTREASEARQANLPYIGRQRNPNLHRE